MRNILDYQKYEGYQFLRLPFEKLSPILAEEACIASAKSRGTFGIKKKSKLRFTYYRRKPMDVILREKTISFQRLRLTFHQGGA